MLDAEHWLFRLTSEEWLVAARNELANAQKALRGKQHRAGVTQARRAAGMAWNAMLVGESDPDVAAKFGRSYMEHLQALRLDQASPTEIRDAADKLCSAAMTPTLVQLGPGSTVLADAAAAIIAHVESRVTR